jgi:hypothetical protein
MLPSKPGTRHKDLDFILTYLSHAYSYLTTCLGASFAKILTGAKFEHRLIKLSIGSRLCTRSAFNMLIASENKVGKESINQSFQKDSKRIAMRNQESFCFISRKIFCTRKISLFKVLNVCLRLSVRPSEFVVSRGL